MEPLYIEPTEFTPKVFFDPENSLFEISGFSRPENVIGFYKPILKWLEEYNDMVLSQNINFKKSILTLNLKMTYFNSASSKFLLDVMLEFMKFMSKGNKIEVNWYYEEDDEDMFEAGEDYQSIITIPFTMIEMEE